MNKLKDMVTKGGENLKYAELKGGAAAPMPESMGGQAPSMGGQAPSMGGQAPSMASPKVGGRRRRT